MEQKMRMQLFDTDFIQLSDRLVTQDPEFAKGPKEVHVGPIKVEFSLFTKGDIEACKLYLDQLMGNLPIEGPKERKQKKKLETSSPTYREELVERISTLKNPKELVAYLREQGFVFTTLDYLEDLGNQIAVSKPYRKRYQWLVKLLRQAKNPLKNRYDVSVLVGFKGEKLIVWSGDEVLHKAILEGNLDTEIKVPIKFKVKFPPYMQHDERLQFRVQMEDLRKFPDRKPSKVYIRWVSEVMRASPKEIGFPRSRAIRDIYDPDKTIEEVQQQLRLGEENGKSK